MSRPTLLWVDDGAANAESTRRALQSAKVDLTLIMTRDYQDVLNRLHGAPDPQPTHSAAVVWALQIPRLHGLGCLAVLRQDPCFKDLPVVVFSSRALASDVAEASCRGATDNVQKPIDSLRFGETVRVLGPGWTSFPASTRAETQL